MVGITNKDLIDEIKIRILEELRQAKIQENDERVKKLEKEFKRTNKLYQVLEEK